MTATLSNRNTSKPRSALRLISTKELPREEWLEVRKQGIGSSDAAAAVGLNPYKSQLELWLEKTGRDTGLPKTDPDDEESAMYWGNVLEPMWPGTTASAPATRFAASTLYCSIPILTCLGCLPTSIAR